MADEPIEQTFKEKLLFYITAFFILLGTFSLFAFLFLVPFVIEPAFKTIFKQFDTTPAICVTVDVKNLKGVSNCSWTSCKEGCTKDLYTCTQIYVNYRLGNKPLLDNETIAVLNTIDLDVQSDEPVALQQTSLHHKSAKSQSSSSSSSVLSSYVSYSNPQYSKMSRPPSSSMGNNNNKQEFDYNDESNIDNGVMSALTSDGKIIDESIMYVDDQMQGFAPNDSGWYFLKAQLYPNVVGCGYPPMLNCTIWQKQYTKIGSNYSCFYSQVDPKVVISHLDMHQNTLNLVYAMAIPIPSFIISVIYLTFAYFKIYNEDEETQPLDKNAEGIDGGGDEDDEDVHGTNGDINKGSDANNLYGSCDLNLNLNCHEIALPNGSAIIPASGPITPNSDLASFGHQLKVKMVDEMSRDSIDGGLISNSGSVQGNLSKTMTTSISTQHGPIAAV